jgi:hypothetical protein
MSWNVIKAAAEVIYPPTLMEIIYIIDNLISAARDSSRCTGF